MAAVSIKGKKATKSRGLLNFIKKNKYELFANFIITLVGVIIGLYLSPRLEGLLEYNKPNITVEIVETTNITNDVWYDSIYWKPEYKKYTLTLKNIGNAPVDRIKIYSYFPYGEIFILNPQPFMGLEIKSRPVIIDGIGISTLVGGVFVEGGKMVIINGIGISTPEQIGLSLGYIKGFGKEYKVLHGEETFDASLVNLGINETWSTYIYLVRPKKQDKQNICVFSYSYFYKGKEVKGGNDCPYLKTTPYEKNCLKLQDYNYFYADMDIKKSGIQKELEVKPNENKTIMIFLDLSDTTPSQTITVKVAAFGSWDKEHPLCNFTKRINEPLNGICSFKTPEAQGKYKIRFLKTLHYELPSYDACNTGGDGFESDLIVR